MIAGRFADCAFCCCAVDLLHQGQLNVCIVTAVRILGVWDCCKLVGCS